MKIGHLKILFAFLSWLKRSACLSVRNIKISDVRQPDPKENI